MRFSETVKTTSPKLKISRRHEDWCVDNPVYSDAAINFATEQLSKKDRMRKGSVSASSLGGCEREQQFIYLGMPKLPLDAKTAAIFANGSFMHLRWQMEGLSEGYITEAEVGVHDDFYRLTGTMDGLLYDESILELKSINARGFSSVTTFGPKLDHMFQMATYMLCTGRDTGVFLYENKDTQEYTELVVTRDDLPMSEARDRALNIWQDIESKTLVEPLNDCIDQKGWKYNSCPYRDRCLKVHRWEEVDGSRGTPGDEVQV